MSPRVSKNKRDKYLEDRRNQILDSAIEVFGNKGLDVATVDDIAQAVGISKGTIYLYFKSKDEIFDTILAERSSIPFVVDLFSLEKISPEMAELPLQLFLEQAANQFLNMMENYHPLFRLILADSHRFPVQAEHVYNNFVFKANQMLADYLSAQSKAGKIRNLDSPLITARCLIGMLAIYVISQEMLGGKKFMPIEHHVWVKEAVRLFLEGVQVSHK